MNNRVREYRLLFEEIIETDKRFKAQGLDLIEPDEWRQLRDVVGNVLKKLEPKP
jgi:hypothetical protein